MLTVRKLCLLQTQAKVGFFQSLSSASVRLQVCEQLQLRAEEEGVTVVEQGSIATTFLIILQGEVRTVLDGEDLDILGPGDSIGEECLTSANGESVQYGLTVITDDPVEFATLDQAVYESLSAEQDEGLALLRRKNIVGARAGGVFRRMRESASMRSNGEQGEGARVGDNLSQSRLDLRGSGEVQRKMSIGGGLGMGRRASIGGKMIQLSPQDLTEMRHQAANLLAQPPEERTDLTLVQLADWINTVEFFKVRAGFLQSKVQRDKSLVQSCCLFRTQSTAMISGSKSDVIFSSIDSKLEPQSSDR
eukprot:SAG31_NODE_4485_length_3196_cov_1.445270_4_plen_305_part_00